MKTSFRVAAAPAIVAGVAALALAACSPPHQVDSDKRVDTATSFAAPTNAARHSTASAAPSSTTPGAPSASAAAGATPVVHGCTGEPLTKPGELSLACADNNDRLVGITWSSWTAKEAVGKATRETNTCLPNCADGHMETVPNVEVRLENPQEALTDGALIFTQLSVNDEVFPLQ